MGYEFSCSRPEADSVTPARSDADHAPLNSPLSKERVAQRLVAAETSLEVFSFNFEAIADSLGITLAEARQRWRHLELNGPEDGHGIQMVLHDDHAFINIAYWHKGAEAESTIRTLWKCLKVICEEGEMPLVTDHQRNCRIDLETDFEVVLETYLYGVGLNTDDE